MNPLLGLANALPTDDGSLQAVSKLQIPLQKVYVWLLSPVEHCFFLLAVSPPPGTHVLLRKTLALNRHATKRITDLL